MTAALHILGGKRYFRPSCLPERNSIGTHIMKGWLRVIDQTAIYAEAFTGTESFLESFDITKKSGLVACSRQPLTSGW